MSSKVERGVKRGGHACRVLMSAAILLGVSAAACSADSVAVVEREAIPRPSTLKITEPAADSVVSGSIALTAERAANTNPTAMKWYVDDVEVAYDNDGARWSARWDTWNHPNGAHRLFVKSRHESGEWSTSQVIIVTVDNPVELAVSGEAAPFGDLPGWKQSFVDDFPIDIDQGDFPSRVSAKWSAYPYPWTDTSGNGRYVPKEVVSIRDGSLRKHLRSEQGDHLVAALRPKVDGNDRFGTLYGRYSIRFRSEVIPGYKIAWLLWPDEGSNIEGSRSGVGGNGEINFPEMDLDEDAVNGFVHFQDAVVSNDQYGTSAPVDIGEWHTYTFEWTPDLVVMFLDGVEVGRTTERIPDTSMHWVIQTETSLSVEPADKVAGVIEIDWVAAWAYDPEPEN